MAYLSYYFDTAFNIVHLGKLKPWSQPQIYNWVPTSHLNQNSDVLPLFSQFSTLFQPNETHTSSSRGPNTSLARMVGFEEETSPC